MAKVGRVAMLDKQLDLVLIELDTKNLYITEADLRDIALPLDNFLDHTSPPSTADNPVRTTTPDGGSISGTLLGTLSSIRLPYSTTFQAAYLAKLTRPLAPGDCGAWVRDAVTGKVLGYFVAGSPTTRLTMLIPATNIAETLSRRVEMGDAHRQASSPETSNCY